MLPGSKQCQRMSRWTITTWKLMLFYKINPGLSQRCAFICLCFVVSTICLWVINAIGNYLGLVFKEIKHEAPCKTLLLGVFTWERKLTCSVEQHCRRKKRHNICACRSHLSLLQIQLFTELLSSIAWTAGMSPTLRDKGKKSPESWRGAVLSCWLPPAHCRHWGDAGYHSQSKGCSEVRL